MLGHKSKPSSSIETIVNTKEENAKEEIYSSNKPLWLKDVKNSLKLFPSSIKEEEFEKIEDLINQEIADETINYDEYPFYTTTKKIMYSFGDVKDPNKKTVIKISNFMKEYIYLLYKITTECDFKKIIDHFYNKEIKKFRNFKKLKHRNNFFISNNNNDNNNINNNNFTDSNFEEDNENNIVEINDPFNELNLFSDNNIFKDVNNYTVSMPENNNTNNNFCEFNGNERDEDYAENIQFQNMRTEYMDTKTYYDYISCRQQNFLTRGKKFFQNYINSICKSDSIPNELKEINNIEFIAFLLKEEIKKIIITSIKKKHPQNKLFILTQALSVEDINPQCEEETNVLKNFLENYHNDIFLINEFKKKNFAKKGNYNKFKKLKKGKNGEMLLVIKKFVFIFDEEECEFLSRIKSSSEIQIINGVIKLREKLIKMKSQKNNLKNFIVTIKNMLEFIGVDNYYEYFLCKFFIREINLMEIKSSELNNYISKLNKINKKFICGKFENWLNLSPTEKDDIKKEFRNLMNNNDNNNDDNNNDNNNNL